MKALALVDAPDHVCCRYRIRAFAPAMEAAGWALDVEGLSRGTLARFRQVRRASRYDAVILQRKLLPGWQVAALRRHARRLVFDFDDAVLYRDSYDRRGPHSARRLARFRRIARAADAALAGNAFLAACAREAGADPARVAVVPTCIDPSRYPARPERPDRPGIELAWIGSSSTLQGLESRRGLWERVGREVPGSRLRVICDRFPRFDGLEVVEVPWTEAGEAEALAGADVGVAWVPDDLWSRGKCGLKVLQYQAAGLPVVANPVGVHPEMVRSGRTGFLAETDDAWVGALAALAADPGWRRQMGAEARRQVEDRYSVEAWSGAFVAALAGGPDGPAPGPTRTRPAGRVAGAAR